MKNSVYDNQSNYFINYNMNDTKNYLLKNKRLTSYKQKVISNRINDIFGLTELILEYSVFNSCEDNTPRISVIFDKVVEYNTIVTWFFRIKENFHAQFKLTTLFNGNKQLTIY